LEIILFLTLLGSCIGSGVYDYEIKLPNNYELWHINSRDIRIGYREGSSLNLFDENKELIGIEPLVIEYYNDDRYVYAKVISPSDID